jgi:hypothetical protein
MYPSLQFLGYKTPGKQLSLSSTQLDLKVFNERNASWQKRTEQTAKHHNERACIISQF